MKTKASFLALAMNPAQKQFARNCAALLALALAGLTATTTFAAADPLPAPKLVFSGGSDRFYADLLFPEDGYFVLEFTTDLQNWVLAETYPAARTYYHYYFYDYMHPLVPNGFFRLRNTSGNPPARDAWWRAYDHPGYGLRRRIVSDGGSSVEVLELKNLLSGSLREIARVPCATGAIAATFDVSADGEYVCYGINDSNTNVAVIQSHREPSKKYLVPGELTYVCQDRQNRPSSLFYLSLHRPFFSADSGLYLEDSLHVYASPTFRTEVYVGPYLQSEPNVNVGDHPWIGLATSVRSVPQANPAPGAAPYQGLISVYDISGPGGVNSPVLLYEFRAGESQDNSPPYHVDEFFRPSDHGYVILVDANNHGLLVDPVGKRTLPLASNAWSYIAFPYQTTKARIIGNVAGGGTVALVFDPTSFTLAPFAMAFSPLVLENKDNTSLITGYSGSDTAYEFSTATGAGFGGSNALAIAYSKGGYPYAHGLMQVEPGSLDFSSYKALSLKVKNVGTNSQTLTLKFEGYYPYNGVRWSFEETFTIAPGTGWEELTFPFPDRSDSRFVLADSSSIVFFADVGKANTTGSFLIDDVKLDP